MPAGKPLPEPQETRLESDEEIREALLARRAAAGKPAAKGAAAAPSPARPDLEPRPERPLQRPPMALLCILDDGRSDGEWIRLRGDRCVLGRVDGDVRIPHDTQMSGRHAELVRHKTQTGYRWVLSDLQSTNGTFVRIGSTLLRHNNEILAGRGLYRYENAATPPPAVAPVLQAGATTAAWTADPIRTLVPSLVEVTQGSAGQRYSLTQAEYWIGRDSPSCQIARPDDPFLSPRHARLYRDAKGQWHVENNKSLNGLWLRLPEPMPLGSACHFRLGEQRFLFRVL